MPAPVDGRGDVTITAVASDGSERVLAAWSDTVGEYDRLLISRSPDGGRVAVALGRFVRTISTTDGSIITREPIGHSEPSLVFGWPDRGEVVVRDADAPSGPDLPIGGGWTLKVDGDIEQDDGFSGGFYGGGMFVGVSEDTPREELVDAVAEAREEAVTAAARPVALGVMLERDGRWITVTDESSSATDGVTTLHWPPIVHPDGVLLRRTRDSAIVREPVSDVDVGSEFESGPAFAWFVGVDGSVREVAVPLSVSPIAVLPDGRFLLPGGSPIWRDDGDEWLGAFGVDDAMDDQDCHFREGGTGGPLLVGGELIRPSRIIASVAPDLLPDPMPADPAHPAWRNDEGFWVHAGRVSEDGSTLTLLLAEADWTADWDQPDAANWLVVDVSLQGDARIRLIARGGHPDGDAEAIAL